MSVELSSTDWRLKPEQLPELKPGTRIRWTDAKGLHFGRVAKAVGEAVNADEEGGGAVLLALATVPVFLVGRL